MSHLFLISSQLMSCITGQVYVKDLCSKSGVICVGDISWRNCLSRLGLAT